MVSVCILALLCGGIRSYAYETGMDKRCAPYQGKTLVADLTVKGIPQSSEHGYGVLTEFQGIDCFLFCKKEFPYEAGERIRVLAAFERTEDDELAAGIPLCAEYELEPVAIGNAEHPLRYLPAKLGGALQNRIRALFPNSSALLLAILTGNRTQLNEDAGLLADLRLCGASHSVAISGMHISYLAAMLRILLGRRKYSSAICIPVLFVFMAMTGFAPSAARAGVMQILLCIAQLSGREYHSLSALFYAMMALLCANPQCAKSVALQLSFAATLGIILFSKKMIDNAFRLRGKRHFSPFMVRLHKTAASVTAVSLGAMAFSLSLSLVYFGQVSLLAPLSSLLLLWSISLSFSLGLLAVLLSLISFPLAALFAVPLDWLFRYFSWAARLMGKIPLAVITTQTLPPLCWLLSFYALLPFLLPCRRISRKRSVVAFYALLGFALSWIWELLPTMQGEARYALLDVGQGQCAVVSAGNEVLMIDCGGGFGRNAGDIAADYLGTMCRTRVDALILTHYHSDHTNGIKELLNRVRVKTAYVPTPALEDEAAIELLNCLRGAGVCVKLVRGPEALLFGRIESLMIPPEEESKDNEGCLSVWTRCGDFEAFITGDAGFETELAAAAQAEAEWIDLLVVGHHGSETSCSEEFLMYTHPKEAYISVGSNHYGLPSELTLKRLRTFGIPTHRTDLEGHLIYRYEGETV